MEIKRKTKNPHKRNSTIDLLHVIICVVIVALAVIGFMNPTENMKLFALIFALAAVLNFINGIPHLKRVRGAKSRLASGLFLCLVGVILLGMAVVSLVVFW
ncbi:MAG: hypothetical protein IKU83_04140 [Lachnospiraceae bacterium]|nr:hypothetical protein [Lachnospiraceae bacterium]